MTDTVANHSETGPIDDGTSLADLTHHQVRMAVAPWATVTWLVIEALGCHRGAPSSWYGPVRDVMTSDEIAFFGPVFNGRSAAIPDSLVPPPDSFDPTFGDELERVAATPEEQLVADLATEDLLDTEWSRCALEPRKWLGSYLAMVERAWMAVRPLWDRASPFLESEVQRVGTALARGSFDVLLDGLTPRGRVVDGQWFLNPLDGPLVAGPGMVVAPLIGGTESLIVAGDDHVVRYLAYPLPAPRRLVSIQRRTDDGECLRALLGAPRAELLCRLDQPVAAGALAEAMHYAPSAISHHLDALERAGLARRERSGRHVLVHRTPRGTALVNLYLP
jgi:DNA-binding transcriptional ArsR family regulator